MLYDFPVILYQQCACGQQSMMLQVHLFDIGIPGKQWCKEPLLETLNSCPLTQVPQQFCASVQFVCILPILITKYGSTLYIGMDEVLAHYTCTFEILDLHFHFQ